jgi:signal peptidase I
VGATDDRVFSGDFLISAKFLRPRRWDLIAFRYPEDPSIPYVMRVVGMPGEQVAIKNGDVWIDGARAKNPGNISGLVYLAHPLAEESVIWGPVQLNRGEYLVLGDFSRRSKDSRVGDRRARSSPLCRPRVLRPGGRDAHLLAAFALADLSLIGSFE